MNISINITYVFINLTHLYLVLGRYTNRLQKLLDKILE